MAFGFGAKKKKGKSSKKKEPKMSQEEVQKNLKQFLKIYQDSAKKHDTELVSGIFKKLKSLTKSEEPVSLIFDIVVSEPITIRQLHALLETLDNYPHYNTLRFWKVPLGNELSLLLAEWLRPNFKLKILELLDCQIDRRGCAALSTSLHHNESLTHLIMDYNDIGDEGISALSVGVSWNPSLQFLSLRYCGIGPEGSQAVATEIIGKSQSIIELDLQGNPLGPKGVTHIGKSLKSAQKLQKLSIADTAFGHSTTAIQALSDGLQYNQSILELNLHLNTLELEGATFLLNVLKEQKILRVLKLYEFQQNLPDTLFQELKDAVAKNKPATKKKGKGKKGKKKK